MIHEVACAIIVRSQRLLLGLRSPSRAYYPGVWDVFGGHVEPGEPHEQTMLRELHEELGIEPTQWTFLETIQFSSQPPPDRLIVHIYTVTAWTGTPANRQIEEHSAIGWFSLEQARQLSLAHPRYAALFERVLASE
jgi:8-oxo-dGTP diphosphatase